MNFFVNRDRRQLETKVKSLNNCNRIANELHKQLMTIFKPLPMGTKVIKADGTLLAKYHKLVKALPIMNDPDVHVIVEKRNNYNISYLVRTCENNGIGGCAYSETTVFVADLEGGTYLKPINKDEDFYTQPEHKTDYDADEIIKLRKVCEQKRKEYEAVRSELHPFGEE